MISQYEFIKEYIIHNFVRSNKILNTFKFVTALEKPFSVYIGC